MKHTLEYTKHTLEYMENSLEHTKLTLEHTEHTSEHTSEHVEQYFHGTGWSERTIEAKRVDVADEASVTNGTDKSRILLLKGLIWGRLGY